MTKHVIAGAFVVTALLASLGTQAPSTAAVAPRAATAQVAVSAAAYDPAPSFDVQITPFFEDVYTGSPSTQYTAERANLRFEH